MLSELSSAAKVVGVKQSKKVIRDGGAKQVFIAADAERRITDPIRALCEQHRWARRSASPSALPLSRSQNKSDFNGTNSR